jgi:hypothetical protein
MWRLLWLAVACMAPACNLYNDVLLGQAKPADGPATGGSRSGGGGAGGSGGTASGGAPPVGGSAGDGGDGQAGMGGEGASDGGSDPGGGGTGGDGAGGSGGSGGSGGAPPVPPIGMIDDFKFLGTASYNNAPFFGAWDRYIEPGGTWATTLTSAMVQARPDDTQNFAIHVVGSTLDDWGAGVLVTVNGGSPMDWTDAHGIKFDVATMNGEAGLRVGLADINSHLPACMAQNGGADCDKHMRAAQTFTIDDTFTAVDIPISAFTDLWIAGRASALDLTAVCALHFQLDPAGAAVDYYIDNVETY